MTIAGLRTTVKKINGDTLTPIQIFQRLQGTHKFLLESASPHNGDGRYSIIGANPRKSYVGRNEQLVETVLATKKTYTHYGDLFILLKRLMPRVVNDSIVPFFGGAVGYIGSMQYDVPDELTLPDVYFHIYDTVIVYDHLVDEVMIVHTNIDPEQQQPDLEAIAEQILHGDSVEEGYTLAPFTSDYDKQAFTHLVEQAKRKLAEHQCAQIVVSRRLQAKFHGNAFDVYRSLRKLEATPYMSYMEFDDHVLISTSPAGLVNVTGDKVQAIPMTGTIARGHDFASDTLQQQALLHDAEQVARHEVLVQVYAEDLQKVTVQDTVQVLQSLQPVNFQSVIHLASELEGTLLPMLHSMDALVACLPGAAVTGAPKLQAAAAVAQLENKHRSFYGGAIGYIGFNGNLQFALTIRSMLIRNNMAYTQVGATVSEGTDSTTQFDNTERKIASFIRLSEEQGV